MNVSKLVQEPRDAAAVEIVRNATAAAVDVTANQDAVLKANYTPNTSKGESAIANACAATANGASAVEGIETVQACTVTINAATVAIANNDTNNETPARIARSPNSAAPGTYPRDRPDVHVKKAIAAFKASISWANFVTSVRGRGDLHPGVKELPHPAAYLLSRFEKSGTPAMMKTAHWSAERIYDALRRGPHKSSHCGIEFL